VIAAGVTDAEAFLSVVEFLGRFCRVTAVGEVDSTMSISVRGGGGYLLLRSRQ
jgi:hypothetical protein